jgi:hypothetical protein
MPNGGKNGMPLLSAFSPLTRDHWTYVMVKSRPAVG